ncbi:cobalt-precorrin-5B (C(1))-methyltransferase [Methanosalsum natronophilum]|uniref:Cobalt-precorrin-5B C(1)-methyltransferase n=1 Tax=Methanosalsum natronophilum TaxID=768733 RepID=A0A424Z4D6_9EURY|nr:cobalt-precorrin-5B (C(1))-methyltransferase [Methanosalsum natronophilum]MCS3923971.1 cobalt-precorrin-5B (C1)-methyltransferase [Methanosalsum natronophilum]RQD92182.1 MAG: cobalt-precorrin-5B (C(1))-methyltransferase [Methanosalsum natronophilum]
MIDPVNKSEIPDEWIEISSMESTKLIEGINKGIYVLLSNGSILNRGYTTGTTAAIAAKAAVLSLKSEVNHVSVPTPVGIRASMAVKSTNGYASVKKPFNDHESDITKELEFEARAIETDEIQVDAGRGIGIVYRDGLQIDKGNPAINPVPMKQIKAAIKEAVDEIGISGAKVTISLPKGEEIAKKTLNYKVGIKGGISIAGTTGFVEPWNDHLGEMKVDLIKESSKVVLTTGRLGIRYSNILFPDHTVVLAGNRISEALKVASGDVIICGLPGLILKWGYPEILENTQYASVAEMIANDLKSEQILKGFQLTAKKAENARVVIVNRQGTIILDSEELK